MRINKGVVSELPSKGSAARVWLTRLSQLTQRTEVDLFREYRTPEAIKEAAISFTKAVQEGKDSNDLFDATDDYVPSGSVVISESVTDAEKAQASEIFKAKMLSKKAPQQSDEPPLRDGGPEDATSA